ncbi:4-(cytidine 5'-diphospho)-2-C-methyl-D-erythritol kinase [Halothiobacillus sp.]|uniref:4-(cytidine 5'-diphospho)-2-C-methyl-D-erythritol kinase n=1 Tax=Halothiobacillus sp. TaxID=1891311 RepID=UPI0026220F18|nr:4-(cytidine 5'-diphospho)-2-C-methyl-D-erythritol kinase [Halothiobacillus sp.]
MTPDAPSRWLAPVKVNLFLHINGKIPEGAFRGYHELQTYFQRLDYGDELTFEHTCEPDISVQWQEGAESIALKPTNECDDLIYRAAALLQETAVTQRHSLRGARITLTKNTPVGGGLGGGSSAAATTLLALNQLWGVHLPLMELVKLARELGADVPFFLYQTNAWAEGIGDRITPYPSPVATQWFVLVVPNTRVMTANCFAHPDLIRNEVKSKPDELVNHWQQSGYNAFESIAHAENANIAACHQALRQATGFSRMTGSGSSLFSPVTSLAEAEHTAIILARDTEQIQRVIIAKALPDSPIAHHE